ncbi:PilZ domain-containing protein [Thermodesulfobacteriota bacterium]
MSDFKDLNKRIRLKCTCPCGHSFPVSQERRAATRKAITITGAYFHNKKKIRGLITVTNISKSGVGLELSTKQSLVKGDKLQLKFNLDNFQKSFIDKEGVVRKIEGYYLGIEFLDAAWEDEVLQNYFADE